MSIDNIQNLQLYGSYYHTKTNNLYIVTNFCKVKDEITREWKDGVEYTSVFPDKNGQKPTYVRTIKDFVANFKNA